MQVEHLQVSEARRLQGREATLGSLKRVAEAAYPGHKLTPLQSREYSDDKDEGVREAVPFLNIKLRVASFFNAYRHCGVFSYATPPAAPTH